MERLSLSPEIPESPSSQPSSRSFSFSHPFFFFFFFPFLTFGFRVIIRGEVFPYVVVASVVHERQ